MGYSPWGRRPSTHFCLSAASALLEEMGVAEEGDFEFNGRGLVERWVWLDLPITRGPGGKASACNAGDMNLIPGSGRSPGEGNGNPLQYICLENSINSGAWWATVHGVTKSQT